MISAMKEAEFEKLPPLIKSPPRRDLQSIIYNFLGVYIWKLYKMAEMWKDLFIQKFQVAAVSRLFLN